jgi:D-threo-aldose 1-dehydrogenase
MRAAEAVEIGATGVRVTRLGLGTGPLGNLFRPVSEQDAASVIERALEHGIAHLDTAPIYGFGLAEHRVGRVLRGVQRSRFVVSTKVGRLLREDAPPDPSLFHNGQPFFVDTPALSPVWDLSYDGALRSLAESLQRLGLDRVEIALVHEPPAALLNDAIDGAFRALDRMRDEGVVGAIGIGHDDVELLERFVAATDCDCVLLANRHTLLDQSALARLLPLCRARSVPVLAGGVFNSGILADPGSGAMFDYVPAPRAVLARARALAAIARRFGTTLPSAALRFPFTDPAVISVIVGARTVDELDQNVAAFESDVPAALWQACAATDAAGAGSDR